MKKFILITFGYILGMQGLFACAWYDPDYEYFNLFTQSIIQDKSFTPFLLTYSNPYYIDEEVVMPDDNIEDWQKYFKNQLTFAETKELVYKVSMDELNNLKFKRPVNHPLLKKLGYKFYVKYKDAMDYLIQAKYMEPYMRIQYVDNPNSFYNRRDDNVKDVSGLNFSKVASALVSLYNATESTSIKLRYGYQLVRFLHYNRNYMGAIDAFKKYIQPLKIKNTVYYMALDQMAGAQRGVGLYKDANWNFFQVFLHTQSRKTSAYSSMKINNQVSFQDILDRTSTKDEKVMAYFILGYQDFNNPLSMMKKIYEIDPTAEALKVLEARAINELERTFLSTTYYFKTIEDDQNTIVNHPNRIPLLDNKTIYIDNEEGYKELDAYDYLLSIENFTQKVRDNHQDAFWDISLAYLKFLQKKYTESQEILASIKTDNTEYLAEIKQMKMLNEIVSQPIINKEFEEHMIANYQSFFIDNDEKDDWSYYYNGQSTNAFLSDILANRYYIQGEYAKSYLMSNELTDLEYDPNFELAQALENFYYKKDKTSFEQKVLTTKFNVDDPDSFFSLIYGDYYARKGAFSKALKNYNKVKNGKGFILTTFKEWDYEKKDYVVLDYPEDKYDLFNNISPFIFGHNYFVSYGSPDEIAMEMEPFADEFNFIQKPMNKIELMKNLIALEEIAKEKGEKASKANQLIGNLLYNTSKLGYYRHIFIMDTNNGNGTKFHFYGSEENNKDYFFKNYYSRTGALDSNFDEAKKYYQKAITLSDSKEQQAQLLFQLASIEQGEYYQWEAEQPEIPYSEDQWYEKEQQLEKEFQKVKQERFKSNFKKLKQGYLDTQTVKQLSKRCSYFEQFLQN